MDSIFYIMLSVLIVSSISLIGVFTLSLGEKQIHKISNLFVGLATGALFGDVFIHILPEIYANQDMNFFSSIYILAGLIGFLVLEKVLHWRHCHIVDDKDHIHPVATMNIVGDSVHNLIDGALIAASYFVNPMVGISTTIAVILHEIPQEVGDFGVMIHKGISVKKALFLNFVSGLTALLGAVIVILIGNNIDGFIGILLAITSGGFVYIAGSDLIPELKHEEKIGHSIWQIIFILAGIGSMYLLLLLE